MCLLWFVFSQTASAQNADIWGVNGEKWVKDQPLQDFSTAGYKQANEPIPDFPIGVNVRDYGAKGDGTGDDSGSFVQAIAACPPNQAVYVPDGTYALRDWVKITKSNLVLRGQSQTGTILYLPVGLQSIHPDNGQTTTGIPTSNWSWGGGFMWFEKASNVGIENFTIKAPDLRYAGHWKEPGHNGVNFVYCKDAWARNLTFYNCDSGIFIKGSSYVTLKDFIFDSFSGRPEPNGNCGHHAVDFTGSGTHHCLMDRAVFKNTWWHELGIEHQTHHNVYMRCSGPNLHFDHHQNDPHDNLWTDCDVGKGTAIWANNARNNQHSRAGSTANEVFWNIRSDINLPYPEATYKNIIIGMTSTDPSARAAGAQWYETIDPVKLDPPNIYLAQLARRLGNPQVNAAPLLNAGLDQSITFLATASLSGSVSDDGLPSGKTVTQSWSKVSGPGTVTFSASTAKTTTASFSVAGTYTLRLTVTDTALSSADEVVVTVNPAPPVNKAPVVSAGTDQSITLPATASLSGSVSDDGLPSGKTVTQSWSKVSGPGTVTFSASTAKTTTASFSVAGTYTLRLTATDTALSTTDDVVVTVNAQHQAPSVALTSPSQAITITALGSVHLTASANASGGSITTVEFLANGSVINTQKTAPYDWTWDGVPAGTYAISARAFDDLGVSTTSAAVTVVVLDPFTAQVNFQPASAPVVNGWLVDSGLPYDLRSNGLSYGWNGDNSNSARDRNATTSVDQIHDTMLHLQKRDLPDAQWEIAVPNGRYQVRVIAGDPGFIDSHYRIEVEGTVAIDTIPTATSHWIDNTITVIVGDGRLTVSNATGADNNKINAIVITQLPPANG